MKILLVMITLATLFSFSCSVNSGEVVRKIHQSTGETIITSYHFIAGRYIKKVQKIQRKESWSLILREQGILLRKTRCYVSKEVSIKVKIGDTFDCEGTPGKE